MLAVISIDCSLNQNVSIARKQFVL